MTESTSKLSTLVGYVTRKTAWSLVAMIGLIPPDSRTKWPWVTKVYTPVLYLIYVITLVEFSARIYSSSGTHLIMRMLKCLNGFIQLSNIIYVFTRRREVYEEMELLRRLCRKAGVRRDEEVSKMDLLLVLVVLSCAVVGATICGNLWIQSAPKLILQLAFDIVIHFMLSSKIMLFYVIASLSKMIVGLLADANRQLKLRGPGSLDEYNHIHSGLCDRVEYLNKLFSVPLHLTFSSILIHTLIIVLMLVEKRNCSILSLVFNLFGTAWICYKADVLAEQFRMADRLLKSWASDKRMSMDNTFRLLVFLNVQKLSQRGISIGELLIDYSFLAKYISFLVTYIVVVLQLVLQ